MTSRAIAHAAIATAALVSTLAFAGSGMPHGAPKASAESLVQPATTYGPKKLVNTWFQQGNGSNAPLTQFGFTTIETSTVNCNNAAGCTIGLESMVQLKPQGGDWAICLLVDGTTTSCQYQGHLASTSGYVVGNAQGLRTGVTSGAHTVATQIYAEGAGATYTYYQTAARVYKP